MFKNLFFQTKGLSELSSQLDADIPLLSVFRRYIFANAHMEKGKHCQCYQRSKIDPLTTV